jgi:hypothetical protein
MRRRVSSFTQARPARTAAQPWSSGVSAGLEQMHVAVDGLGRPAIVKQEDAFSSPCCDSRRIRPPPPPAKLADIFRAARRLKSDIVFWDDKRSGRRSQRYLEYKAD